MATVPVKYFHSGMAGAPVLSGTAGAMIAILDACLVNGFGLKTVDSLVVAANVATMNISTGHSFEVGSVALVAGATPSSLNGEWRVTAVTTNTVQFATSGISDQAATGTITTKLAPLGWNKPYGTGNYAAYKSSDPTSQGNYLRVDDTNATEARVRGFVTMLTVDNGTDPFPTDMQINGGGYWCKSIAGGSTARNWLLVGDGLFFWLWCVPHQTTSVTSQGTFYAFGDPIVQGSTDVYSTMLLARGSADSRYASGPGASWESNYTFVYAPRSYSAIGGSTRVYMTDEGHLSQPGYYSGNTNGSSSMAYPNASDGGLYLTRTLLMENYSNNTPVLRAILPGTYYLPQNVGFALNSFDVTVGQGPFNGRRIMALRFGYGSDGQNGTGGYYGVLAMDMTGPWR